MNKMVLMLGLVAATAFATTAQAQCQTGSGCGLRNGNERPIYNGFDAEGWTTTNDVGCVNPLRSAALSLHNPYSPHRYYSYSNRGIRAGLTHQWNQQQAMSQPWHAGYQYWRYGQPTALVVPPTAAYQTSYGWGVGQVRSYPIHHQYGKAGAGMTGGEGAGQFQVTPYWPSHTDQMGVYSVRAPF